MPLAECNGRRWFVVLDRKDFDDALSRNLDRYPTGTRRRAHHRTGSGRSGRARQPGGPRSRCRGGPCPNRPGHPRLLRLLGGGPPAGSHRTERPCSRLARWLECGVYADVPAAICSASPRCLRPRKDVLRRSIRQPWSSAPRCGDGWRVRAVSPRFESSSAWATASDRPPGDAWHHKDSLDAQGIFGGIGSAV